MDTATLVAVVGVVAAIAGATIGGLISYFSTRSVKLIEWRLLQTDKEISKRESAYAEFLSEANRLMVLGMGEKISSTAELEKITILEARLWFFSSATGASARKICNCILNINRTDPDPNEPKFPPLRDQFVTACRQDLDQLRSAAMTTHHRDALPSQPNRD